MSKAPIKYVNEYKQIMLELRAQNFDVIRFATYRTACKLRFIQKKLNLHLIDLWNVIETFRENNLHTLDILYEIDLTRLELIVTNMYTQLNKRLSITQHINVDTMSLLLTSWLINLYDNQKLNKIKLFSFKIALTTLCTGKLVDKIKYIYTQISDPTTNSLIITKFELYLKELLQIPTSVYEEPSFGYTELTSKTCFDLTSTVNLEEFLDIALSDTGPACFIWLNIYHRMILVQNVIHPVTCNVCQRNNFIGFRYKCQKCRNYQLCQDCFWRGRVSGSHQLSHQMKEYTVYKSTAKQLSSSLKRSFFCKPKNSTVNTNTTTNPGATSSSTATTSANATNINKLDATVTNNMLANSGNSEYLLCRIKQQPQTQSQHSTLASFTQQPYFLTSSSTAINQETGCGKKLSPCCSSKKDIDSKTKTIYKKPIDLSHIVPTPVPIQHQQQPHQHQQIYSNTLSMTRKSVDSFNSNKSLMNLLESKQLDQTLKTSFEHNNEEHRLIARYASRLANYYQSNKYDEANIHDQSSYLPSNVPINQTKNQNTRSLSESNFRSGSNHSGLTNTAITNSILNSEAILNEKKQLIAKLEQKNREIIREIKRLRLQQESNRSLDENYLNLNTSMSRESTPLTINSSSYTSKSLITQQLNQNFASQQHQPHILAELKSLKQRKGELDSRIQILEHNRNELLTQLSQLDTIMKNMKSNSLSTRSTPIRAARDQTPSKFSTYAPPFTSSQLGRGVGMTSSAIGSLSSASPYNDSLAQLLQTSYKVAQIQPQAQSTQMTSPLLASNISNPYQQQQQQSYAPLTQIKSSSVPTTPAMSDYYYNYNFLKHNIQSPQFYSSGHNTISSNSSSNAYVRNLRNDLLIAADSVTNAMHSLVKELNSENESVRSIINSNDNLDFENNNNINTKNKIDENNQNINNNTNNNNNNNNNNQIINTKNLNDKTLNININEKLIDIKNSNDNTNTNYRIFVDDKNENDSELDSNLNNNENNNNNKDIKILSTTNNKDTNLINNLNQICTNVNEKQNDTDIDDQKSITSTTIDDTELAIKTSNAQIAQKQQILDLDEDAFYFTDSLLANNLQVALWRRELEQRLNPASPPLSPSSSTKKNNVKESNNNNNVINISEQIASVEITPTTATVMSNTTVGKSSLSFNVGDNIEGIDDNNNENKNNINKSLSNGFK